MQAYTRIVNGAGALIAFWDDSARTFTAWDDTGSTIIEGPRAYTPQENADADARISLGTLTTNRLTLEDRALDAINTNTQVINQLKSFAAGTASLTNTQRDNALRDLANQQARALSQINALARLAISEFSGTE